MHFPHLFICAFISVFYNFSFLFYHYDISLSLTYLSQPLKTSIQYMLRRLMLTTVKRERYCRMHRTCPTNSIVWQFVAKLPYPFKASTVQYCSFRCVSRFFSSGCNEVYLNPYTVGPCGVLLLAWLVTVWTTVPPHGARFNRYTTHLPSFVSPPFVAFPSVTRLI